MSWQQIKRLNEERAQLLGEMKAILNKAETEKRDLTEAENKEFDDKNTKAEAKRTECERYEKVYNLERQHKDDLEKRKEFQPGRDDIDTPEKRQEAQRLEYRKAFDTYLRRGLNGEETRALTISGVGGVVGDRPFYDQLVLGMKWYAGVRQAGATILPTSDGNTLTVPKLDDSSNTGQIVGEGNEDDTEAEATPGFIALNPQKFDSKWIKLSIELLQDAAFPVEATVISQASERIGRAFNTFSTTGTGSGQPQGFVTAGTVGLTTAATNAITYDEMISAYHSVDPAYRQSGKAMWMFHDTTLAALRKLKDGNGRYIFEPGIPGAPGTILSAPYVVNNDMSQLGAGNVIAAFGDFSRYFVRDVTAPYIVRADELFAASGLIGYRVFSRHDGRLADTNAIRLVQNHA